MSKDEPHVTIDMTGTEAAMTEYLRQREPVDDIVTEIVRWRDVLRDAVNSTLTGGAPETVKNLPAGQRLNPLDIPEDERRNLERARDHLYAIDELLKIARGLPEHACEHMLHSLWTTIGATYSTFSVSSSRSFGEKRTSIS